MKYTVYRLEEIGLCWVSHPIHNRAPFFPLDRTLPRHTWSPDLGIFLGDPKQLRSTVKSYNQNIDDNLVDSFAKQMIVSFFERLWSRNFETYMFAEQYRLAAGLEEVILQRTEDKYIIFNNCPSFYSHRWIGFRQGWSKIERCTFEVNWPFRPRLWPHNPESQRTSQRKARTTWRWRVARTWDGGVRNGQNYGPKTRLVSLRYMHTGSFGKVVE